MKILLISPAFYCIIILYFNPSKGTLFDSRNFVISLLCTCSGAACIPSVCRFLRFSRSLSATNDSICSTRSAIKVPPSGLCRSGYPAEAYPAQRTAFSIILLTAAVIGAAVKICRRFSDCPIGQSDRNIRGIRESALKKIHKLYGGILTYRKENNLSMTHDENFLKKGGREKGKQTARPLISHCLLCMKYYIS